MLATLASLGLVLGGVEVRPPPNVVLIVIDDVGIDQLKCYEAENRYSTPYAYAYTPTLDALAANGARFTQCRTPPLCSPSRACLLTGRYGFRTGVGALIKPANSSPTCIELGNPLPEVILPTILAGRRGAIGKWHLGLQTSDGGTMPAHPASLGFLSWRGVFANLFGEPPLAPGIPGYRNFLWWDSGVSHVEHDFATIYTRSQASRWVSLHREQPFFLYLAFNGCHLPMTVFDVPPQEEHGFGIPSHMNSTFRANLECLDRQLGIFLATLPSDTYVFIVGDNGTSDLIMKTAAGEPRYPLGHPLHQAGDETAQLSTAPYDRSHFKFTQYESGIRVPFIVSGPAVVPGARSDLVDAVDLFATIAALRHAPIPGGAAQDSCNFAGVLTGAAGTRAFSFSEHFEPNGREQIRTTENRSYIREEGTHLWKVIQRLGVADEFYDVARDPLERTNLGTSSAAYRETARLLANLLATESL